MLVLTRKSGQSVLVGDEITVKVIAIDGERARLGFDAPADCTIRRDELAGPRFDLADARAREHHERQNALLLDALDYLITISRRGPHAATGGRDRVYVNELYAMRDAIAGGETLSGYVAERNASPGVAA